MNVVNTLTRQSDTFEPCVNFIDRGTLIRIVRYLAHAQPCKELVIASDLRIDRKVVVAGLHFLADYFYCRATRLGWILTPTVAATGEPEEVVERRRAEKENAPTPDMIAHGTVEVQRGYAINSRTGKPIPAWTEEEFYRRAGVNRSRSTLKAICEAPMSVFSLCDPEHHRS